MGRYVGRQVFVGQAGLLITLIKCLKGHKSLDCPLMSQIKKSQFMETILRFLEVISWFLEFISPRVSYWAACELHQDPFPKNIKIFVKKCKTRNLRSGLFKLFHFCELFTECLSPIAQQLNLSNHKAFCYPPWKIIKGRLIGRENLEVGFQNFSFSAN